MWEEVPTLEDPEPFINQRAKLSEEPELSQNMRFNINLFDPEYMARQHKTLVHHANNHYEMSLRTLRGEVSSSNSNFSESEEEELRQERRRTPAVEASPMPESIKRMQRTIDALKNSLKRGKVDHSDFLLPRGYKSKE